MPEEVTNEGPPRISNGNGHSDYQSDHKENSNRGNGMNKGSLREGDPEDILSQVGNTLPDEGESYFHRKKSEDFGEEDSPVVPNPMSLSYRFADRNESRYSDEEDERQSNRPYSPVNSTYACSPSELNSTQGQKLKSPKSPRRTSFFGSLTPAEPNRFKKQFSRFSRRNKKPIASKRQLGLKNEIRTRQEKEAAERAQQIISSLSLGTPSINLLASLLLVDEEGISRAPLLLTLLGLTVRDSSPNVNTKNRKLTLDLEYGVGSERMKWTVEKAAKDFLYLHSRLKLSYKWKKEVIENKNSLPKLPVPPLTNKKRKELARELDATSSNHSNDIGSLRSGGSRFLGSLRRQTSNASLNSTNQYKSREERNAQYVSEVEKYLKVLIERVALKPQSNKLFRFFELSPISSLLSYETGYSGKQGDIHISGTASSQGWRVGHFKATDIKAMVARRSEMWLLVRNSYVMYVSNINSTIPLDIFLVDPAFEINYKGDIDLQDDEDLDDDYDDQSLKQKIDSVENTKSHKVFKHLKIYLENRERKLVLHPKSRMEQKLWIKSLIAMKNSTIYSQNNRFGSFAPVRQNCFAQWVVDGRDHFWAISSALEMAKETIFIHDWWLSPELYLRRPANGNQQWRLDRLLQRKAKQGVKIFVIIYRNVGTTVVTDSLYTKHSLLSLDEENIHVIRSPNQWLQNTYFWAHHEKLCIVDQSIAFVGGIDLCYGRFDTPDHALTDDSNINFDNVDSTPKNADEEFNRFEIFPGKDYSNPRVRDFHDLDKPYDDIYDKNEVPRMPWHDVHMITGGPVARDLARHFVQRWNYLLRQKRPSRYTPLLTPPPDMSEEEAEQLGLNGTCEVQLCRSAGSWSLGLKEREQSIQNAYLKLIETSEHFVYIENQFFITSCVVDGTVIHNRIGDALVERAIRAHKEKTAWKAIIVIPLMPGFEAQVDELEGSSVRVIMQCQYMSISRGHTSIFAKLRKYGIEPEDYIQFYSLRKWSRIGEDRNLVTEQLYIHAKTMIVDDRVAIIGSANINERSQRGLRDSEVAAVVRDNETILSTMNGQPYQVGKFPHTLRMRLMREHLGVNVDILDIVERRFQGFEDFAETQEGVAACTGAFKFKESIKMSAMVEIASRDILGVEGGTPKWQSFQAYYKRNDSAHMPKHEEEDEEQNISSLLKLTSFNYRTGAHEANKGIRDKKKHSYDPRVQHSDSKKKDVYGDGFDKYKTKLAERARLNSVKFLADLARVAMDENPTKAFIPDIESVSDFLEGDDVDMFDEMDEESERLITMRNNERWLLLKKISYLQRVAAKEMVDREVESKRRVAANLSPITPFESKSAKASPEPTDETISSTVDIPTEDKENSDSNPAGEKKTDSTGEKSIPVVQLNEEEAREIISGFNPEGVDSFVKFIDPYKFEDPLIEEFSEDSWFENARRNTEIFRLIFHSQPDDLVQSWKDYKDYANLYAAFAASQKKQASYRKQNRPFKDEDDSDGTRYRHGNKSGSISLSKHERNIGLIGNAPDLDNNDDEQEEEDISEEDFVTETYLKHKNEAQAEMDNMLNIPTPNGGKRKSRQRGTISAARRKAQLGRKVFELDSAERILNEVQGHLVLFPTEWLLRELEGGNWFYNNDRIPPIEIYD